MFMFRTRFTLKWSKCDQKKKNNRLLFYNEFPSGLSIFLLIHDAGNEWVSVFGHEFVSWGTTYPGLLEVTELGHQSAHLLAGERRADHDGLAAGARREHGAHPRRPVLRHQPLVELRFHACVPRDRKKVVLDDVLHKRNGGAVAHRPRLHRKTGLQLFVGRFAFLERGSLHVPSFALLQFFWKTNAIV